MTGTITDETIDIMAGIGTMEADKLLRAGAVDLAAPDLVLAVLQPRVRAAAKLRGITDKPLVGFLTMGVIVNFGLRLAQDRRPS